VRIYSCPIWVNTGQIYAKSPNYTKPGGDINNASDLV
jgi:hypothetical protein